MQKTRKVVTVVLLQAGLALSAPALAKPAVDAPRPPADSQVSRTLISLRDGLLKAKREDALHPMSRYRALCDVDGYALVGNVANKPNAYQPSKFCADIRRELTKIKAT